MMENDLSFFDATLTGTGPEQWLRWPHISGKQLQTAHNTDYEN
jgi:hypothetical protein